MALDLGIGTQIVACPIVRESDGLALSSRNMLLTAEQRAERADAVIRKGLIPHLSQWLKQNGGFRRGVWSGGQAVMAWGPPLSARGGVSRWRRLRSRC